MSSPPAACAHRRRHVLAYLRLLRPHDRVPGAGDAVLVRAADDARDLVEVEDRRRRGNLPLDRLGPPRVGGRLRAPLPADDHVVDEHQLREAEEEGRDRDHEVPGAELRGVGDAEEQDARALDRQADVVERVADLLHHVDRHAARSPRGRPRSAARSSRTRAAARPGSAGRPGCSRRRGPGPGSGAGTRTAWSRPPRSPPTRRCRACRTSAPARWPARC